MEGTSNLICIPKTPMICVPEQDAGASTTNTLVNTNNPGVTLNNITNSANPAEAVEVSVDLNELILKSQQQSLSVVAQQFSQVLDGIGTAMEKKLSEVAGSLIKVPEGPHTGDRHNTDLSEDHDRNRLTDTAPEDSDENRQSDHNTNNNQQTTTNTSKSLRSAIPFVSGKIFLRMDR